MDQKKINVFISYAHKDKAYFKVFKENLEIAFKTQTEYEFVIWTDHEIELGKLWDKEIQTALNNSDLAILLVSNSFLASDFIKAKELGILINQLDRTIIIPVKFKSCNFSGWDELTKRQFFMPTGDKYDRGGKSDFTFSDLIEFYNDKTVKTNNNIDRYINDLVDKIKGALRKEHNEKALIGFNEEEKDPHIMYAVPNEMLLESEYKCTIRIGFDKKMLIKINDKLTNPIIEVLEGVSEIMEVELINSDKSFTIEYLSNCEQFLTSDEYTEWLFLITPHKLGVHLLRLKVSIVKWVKYKESKKNIILEKDVLVTTTDHENENNKDVKIFILEGNVKNLSINQNMNYSSKRINDLKSSLEIAYELLNRLENDYVLSGNPRKKMRLEKEIEETRLSINKYEKEIKEHVNIENKENLENNGKESIEVKPENSLNQFKNQFNDKKNEYEALIENEKFTELFEKIKIIISDEGLHKKILKNIEQWVKLNEDLYSDEKVKKYITKKKIEIKNDFIKFLDDLPGYKFEDGFIIENLTNILESLENLIDFEYFEYFVNREEDLDKIIESRISKNIYLISPAGFGKTYLIKDKLKREIEIIDDNSVYYKYIDLKKSKFNFKDFNLFKSSLADEFGISLSNEYELHYLINGSIKANYKKIYIIFDHIEELSIHADEDFRQSFKGFVEATITNIDQRDKTILIFILSGRSKIFLSSKFNDKNNIHPLSFNKDVIKVAIDRSIKKCGAIIATDRLSFRPNEEFEKLSGGHPKCLRQLLHYFEKPYNYANIDELKTKEKLLHEKFVKPELNEIIKHSVKSTEITDCLYQLLHILSIFRKFDLDILEKLNTVVFSIEVFKKSNSFFTKSIDEKNDFIKKINLFEYEVNYFKDSISRNLFLNNLKIEFGKDIFDKINSFAIKYYTDKLNGLFKNEVKREKFDIIRNLTDWIPEILYHNLVSSNVNKFEKSEQIYKDCDKYYKSQFRTAESIISEIRITFGKDSELVDLLTKNKLDKLIKI